MPGTAQRRRVLYPRSSEIDRRCVGAETSDVRSLPVRRFAFHSRDVEQAHEVLTRSFVGFSVRLCGGVERFTFNLDATGVGQLIVSQVEHGMDIELVTEPFDFFVADVVRGGRLRLCAGREEFRPGLGDVFMQPLGAPVTFAWTDVDVMSIRLPLHEVARVAAERGIAPADLRFEAMSPVSPAMA